MSASEQWFRFIAQAGQACMDLAVQLRSEAPSVAVSHGAAGRVLDFGERGNPTYVWECYVEAEYPEIDIVWWFEVNNGEQGWVGEASLYRVRGDDETELAEQRWAAPDEESALAAAVSALEHFIASRPPDWPLCGNSAA